LAALSAPIATAQHFLEQTEDTYKVQFISGNLTASVTKNWPRVDFKHTLNLLSPMFEISIPRLFLFNDTNGDGVFSLSEAIYTGLMDDNYVKWNVSAVEFGRSDSAGEYATTSMTGWVSLYKGLANQTVDQPVLRNWARLTFSFVISEKPVLYSNARGQYLVEGKTDLKIVLDLAVSRHANATSLAVEQQLLAGGSVYRFMIREQSAKSDGSVLTPVSARDDERWHGLNFTHRIQQTRMPTQDLEFATEQGLVQAHYRYSSVPTTNDTGTCDAVGLNSSYFTTGTSLMLYPAYSFGNRTDNISHEMSIGLDMGGFVRVRDWAMRNLPALAIVVGGLVALTVISVNVWRRKQRMVAENSNEMKVKIEKNDSGPK